MIKCFEAAVVGSGWRDVREQIIASSSTASPRVTT
jgi:hypothetical protein